MKYIALAALAAISFSANAATDSSAKDAFVRLKGMVGNWEQGKGPNKMVVTYRLTGGGSALMETISPGTPHEMVTMYHLDKDQLVMTHYCAAHNQPTMKLVPDSDPEALHFVFVSGMNMDIKDMHMHELKFKFLSKDHVMENWQAWSDGQPGELAKFDLHRAS